MSEASPVPAMRTSLYQNHLDAKARMVPFAGWEMPVQYTGILAEASAVRKNGGIFDVSHMGRAYVSGAQATELLEWIQTGNIGNLRMGRARYSLVCDESGGILDDTVTYRLAEDRYLLICNASNRDTVLGWIDRWREDKFPQTTVEDVTTGTAMIALQGPAAAALADRICPQTPSSLRFFASMEGQLLGKKAFIGRTGYTGEDGFELVVDASDGPSTWDALVTGGMTPCGLGARDVLRLEAGLPLHGNDIDPTTSPLEAGLDRFVRLRKEFAGADFLRRQKEEGVSRKLVGLFAEGRSIPRHDYDIKAGEQVVGKITSGGFSPTLDRNIAMGYVQPRWSDTGQNLQIDIRGRLTKATVTTLPFYTRKRD